MSRLQPGDPLPRFQTRDAQGKTYTEKNFSNGVVILYFYPKDDTPGCTKQACDLRDTLAALNAAAFGVSPDSALTHQAFSEKHRLNFPLLCDENKALCQQFDVLGEKGQVERTTFIFQEGKLRWVERNVEVKGHAERVRKAIESL